VGGFGQGSGGSGGEHMVDP
jgi:kinesin family member 2/24